MAAVAGVGVVVFLIHRGELKVSRAIPALQETLVAHVGAVSEAEEVRRVSQLSRQELEGRLQQLEETLSRLTASIGQQALSQRQSHNGDTSRSVTDTR